MTRCGTRGRRMWSTQMDPKNPLYWLGPPEKLDTGRIPVSRRWMRVMSVTPLHVDLTALQRAGKIRRLVFKKQGDTGMIRPGGTGSDYTVYVRRDPR